MQLEKQSIFITANWIQHFNDCHSESTLSTKIKPLHYAMILSGSWNGAWIKIMKPPTPLWNPVFSSLSYIPFPLFSFPLISALYQITKSHSPTFCCFGIILCLSLYSWSLDSLYIWLLWKIYQSETQSISLCQSVIACNPFLCFYYSLSLSSPYVLPVLSYAEGSQHGPLLWTPPMLKYISCLLPLRDTCHSTYAIVLTIAIHRIPQSAGLDPCPRLYKDLTFDSHCTWRIKNVCYESERRTPAKINLKKINEILYI